MNTPHQADAVESQFTGTFEQYKRLVGDFLKRLKASPAPNDNQVESGLHGLRLGWLYLKGSELEREMALTLITIAERQAAMREANIKT